MRPSANRTPFALSLVFGLGCLGLIAWLLPTGSAVKAQTEKNRLAGKTFSEAQKATSDLFPDQATVLVVDDGTNEAAAGISGGGTVTGVNRLTPTSYPATITGVSLFFQSQQGLPPASPITILVGTNPSGGTNINNVTFSQISAAVETVGSYYFYPVAPVTIISGDFVVGFRATHAAGELPLAIDRTPPMNRRSYVSTGGTTFTILDDAIPPLAGNLMIRARVQGQPPGCPSLSGTNPPGGAIGSQVTITGNNFNGVTGVRFFNNVAAQFTINSNTQITATVPQGAATGPVTISKPSCPDVQTSAFAVNTSSPTELAVDDGSFETGSGLSGGGTSWRVNRLTPNSYPATLNAVSIFFRSTSNLAVGAPLTIVYGANQSGGTNISGLQLQTMESTIQALGQFNVYSVPALTINSGDFVVGYKITHAANVFPFALDSTPPSQRRSYRSIDGTAYQIIDDIAGSTPGNYGIRARLQGAMQNCPTVNGINPGTGAAGSQVTITGTNFTGVNAVRFANNATAVFTVNSDTQITATVPAGAVTGPITISKPNCPDVTTTAFTVASSCTYSINPTSQNVIAGGGIVNVMVTTQAGCPWMAASNATWITITSGANGTGSGSVVYSVAANTGAARNGTMTIAGQTFTVMQAGGSCSYSISPTFRSIGVEGGTGSVAVTTQTGCEWMATSNVAWITITSGASGTGSGTVNYSVASNVGNPLRSGTLTIAGRTFTVDQGGCSYTLSALSQTFSSVGGTGSVNVTAAGGCMWTAVSNAPWITINSGASGNGNGTVNYSVAMNIGPARLGTMTIAGRTFTVAQGSAQPTPYRGAWQGLTDQNLPVRFTVDNNDIVVNLEADVRISFFVPPNSQATCTYRLRGEAPAIINNGQFETLLTSTDATLGFQVGAQPNFRATFSSETASSGQITSSTVGLILCGGNLTFGTINVGSKTWNAQKQAQPGCHSASGINPASGAAGNQVTITGSGFTGANAVRFAGGVNASFTINSDTQITATVPNGAVTGPVTISKPNCPDVATAAFTVNRVCTFAIAPASRFFLSGGGGTGSVNVTAETGCAWMAVSNAAWITITGGANGSGNGRVDYSVAADASGGVRAGTMTIAGQTFTVQQGFSAGSGWSRQTSGVTTELRSVHLVSLSEGWAAGANATLLRTTDGGANWSSVNTGVDPARGFHTVRFFNGSIGWAGGAGAIARTANGGANWAKANLPATVLVADSAMHNSFIFSSPTSTFFQSGGQGSVFGDPGSFLYGYTMDANGNLSASGGSVWTPTSPIFDLFSLQDAGGSFTFMVGGNGSIRLLDSSPLGYSSQPSGTNQQLNAIQMMRAGGDLIGWVVGNGGTILKATNAGSTWTSQASGTTANLRDVHFVDANRGWAVGDGGLILATSNGGNTWMPEPSGVTSDLRGVFFVSAEAGFVVGSNGVILKRTPQPGAVASVSAASFIGTGFAPESIVAAFGQGLAGSIEVGNTVPLPTTLAGTSVVVRDSAGFDSLANPAATDRLAPLFFVSPGQINLQIPAGTPPGTATISVLQGGAVVASGVVQISSVAPGLFAANASGQGVAAAVVFRRRADGSESFEPVAQFDQAQNRLVPLPIDLGPETDQVFLILYGTGLRFNSGLQAMTVSIGGVNSEVFFAGAAPGFVGLDQANVRLSRSLIGRGEVDVVMIVDGMQANVVKVAIK